jgi:ATP-dependent protease Clp ATPase subunit
MQYKELKTYFETNRDKIPESLGNSFCAIPDVSKTVEICIRVIEAELRDKKGDVRKSYPAKAAKQQLFKIFLMIQDTSTHGVSKIIYNHYSNFKRQN